MRLLGGGLSGEGEQVVKRSRWVGVSDELDDLDGQNLRSVRFTIDA